MSTFDSLVSAGTDSTTNLAALIKLAIAEDIGTGDITSNALIDPKAHAIARITAKQSLVLAGMDTAKKVFEAIAADGLNWDPKRRDGDRCEVGDVIAIVQGKAIDLLKSERIVLNFLQHLSGVATLTRKFVDAIRDTNTKILDTRKTTPGWRALEKYAIKAGGGTNHRIGLYDHFLIKNNHLSVTGSVSAALKTAIKARKPGQLIEVETHLLEDVTAAAENSADIIMLDNMSVEMVKKAVKAIKGRSKIEVSGNISLDNVHSYAMAGVDFISVGALTHSAPAADIHMLVMVERHVGEHSISSIDTISPNRLS